MKTNTKLYDYVVAYGPHRRIETYPIPSQVVREVVPFAVDIPSLVVSPLGLPASGDEASRQPREAAM